jgi:APA family basic amino acid/polyamine antiporter
MILPEKNNLLPSLNLMDATLLVIGAVIGSGIFLTSGLIASSLPSVGWILTVWLFGAVISLFGGLTFAELGAMLPEAGGQYVYLREAYGPLAGFMYGWTAFIITQTGGIAALAVGFAEYLAYFFPFLGLDQYLFETKMYSVSAGQIVALGSIFVLTLINFFGIRSGSRVQNFFTIIKLAAISILIIAGFYIVVISEGTVQKTESLILPSGFSLISAVGISLIAVLWTFDGWYAVNTVASEIKNVRKNLPLSLIIGISVIGVVYLLINIFYVSALPLDEMSGVVRIGEKATTFALGSMSGKLMSGLILISIFGCLSATIIFGPRIYYAMANDGLFFKKFSKVHERYHSPSTAILWQGIIAGILCLTGTYEQLFTYVTFAVLVFFEGNVLAVYILRKKRPGAERPYRVWGYPIVPAIFGVMILAIMFSTIMERAAEALIGLVFIVIGLPVYFYWHKNQST